MRLPTKTPSGRHFAGRAQVEERPARDELEPPGGPLLGIDIPIDIDAEDAWVDDGPRARATRSRVAFAVSITLAAVPVLVLDNFPATADTGPKDRPAASVREAESGDAPLTVEADLGEPLDASVGLDLPATVDTIAPPTVYVDTPVTTITLPPVTTAPPTTVAPRATTPTTVKVAPTTTAPARAAISPDPNDPATWDALARCEAGGNWAANTGNGYYGGLQFSLATWQDLGGTGYPHEASKATQIEIGRRLQARSGWDAWPGCARKLGWT
ncbi:MAG TPA: transglycosylase family protein [Acidimicrobiales bacterium]|nr:transglycosylase family protein [Acidimicrobiales bacterium]